MKRLWMIPALLGLLPMLSRADIAVTEGSGKTVATDSISSKEYQKIKLIDGVAGNTSPAPVDPVGGLYVRLTTGTALAGQFQVISSTLQAQLLGTSPVQVLISTLQVQQAGTLSAQVVTSTLQVQVNGTVPVSGTFFPTTQAVSSVGSFSVTPGSGTFPLAILSVTGSTVTVGYQGATVSSVPVSVLGTASVQVLTSTLQVQQSGTLSAQVVTSTLQVQINGTAPVQVLVSTLQVQLNGTSPVQVLISTLQVQLNGTSPVQVLVSTLQVQVNSGVGGFAASGAAASGNPMEAGVRVTSTTIPTAASDGQTIYQASDNIGRTLVSGLPWGLILSTYATVMSSNGVLAVNSTGGQVLVSSAGAATRTYLCGCTFTNTTATTNEAVIMSPPGAIGAIAKTHMIGIPASFVPSGTRHDCGNPFFASAINSNIGIYQSQVAGATSAIHYACTYFQGP